MWVRTDDNELVNLRTARRIYRKGKVVRAVWGPMDETVLISATHEDAAMQAIDRLNHALIEGQTICTLL